MGTSLGDIIIFVDPEKTDILDAFGEPINHSLMELYALKVEKIFAKNNRVQIQTYYNFDKYCNDLIAGGK